MTSGGLLAHHRCEPYTGSFECLLACATNDSPLIGKPTSNTVGLPGLASSGLEGRRPFVPKAEEVSFSSNGENCSEPTGRTPSLPDITLPQIRTMRILKTLGTFPCCNVYDRSCKSQNEKVRAERRRRSFATFHAH